MAIPLTRVYIAKVLGFQIATNAAKSLAGAARKGAIEIIPARHAASPADQDE